MLNVRLGMNLALVVRRSMRCCGRDASAPGHGRLEPAILLLPATDRNAYKPISHMITVTTIFAYFTT